MHDRILSDGEIRKKTVPKRYCLFFAPESRQNCKTFASSSALISVPLIEITRFASVDLPSAQAVFLFFLSFFIEIRYRPVSVPPIKIGITLIIGYIGFVYSV